MLKEDNRLAKHEVPKCLSMNLFSIDRIPVISDTVND